MKKVIIFSIICLCVGCFCDVRFESPQPSSSLKQIHIPKKIIGEYDQGQGDRLIVMEDGIVFLSAESNIKPEKYKLDSSLILFNSMYGVYANLKDTLGFWNCYLIESNDTSMKVSPITCDANKVKIYAEKYQYHHIREDSLLIINEIDYLNLYNLIDREHADVYKKKIIIE